MCCSDCAPPLARSAPQSDRPPDCLVTFAAAVGLSSAHAHTDTASRLDEAAVLGPSAQAAFTSTLPPQPNHPPFAGASRAAVRRVAASRDYDAEPRVHRPPWIRREQLELALGRHDTAIWTPGLSARYPRDREDDQGHEPVRMPGPARTGAFVACAKSWTGWGPALCACMWLRARCW